MNYLDFTQLLSLAVAGVTNILAIYLVVTMVYWIYRLRFSRTSFRLFVVGVLMAKTAVWFWTLLNMLDIIINDTDQPILVLPARFGFLIAVCLQTWVTTKIKPAPHLMSTNLMKELKTGGRIILIVEDNEPLARIYRKILENAGFNAEFATSGRDALVIIGQEKPCLILVDLGLPDMNGVEFVIETRKAGYVGPVAAVSGAIGLVDEEKLTTAGFNEMVSKPLSSAELIALVHRWTK